MNFHKFIISWLVSGILGSILMYGAVKYVDKTAYITTNHIVNGAIFGPLFLFVGVGGWVAIIIVEMVVAIEKA